MLALSIRINPEPVTLRTIFTSRQMKALPNTAKSERHNDVAHEAVAYYAVEQLEPKILLSAAPIDAAPEAYGLSPLDVVDSSALEEVRFANVVECEASAETFMPHDVETSLLGGGEDFSWGEEGESEEAVVDEANQAADSTGEATQDLRIEDEAVASSGSTSADSITEVDADISNPVPGQLVDTLTAANSPPSTASTTVHLVSADSEDFGSDTTVGSGLVVSWFGGCGGVSFKFGIPE